MARVRCITEMGMGVDVHGKDATKAAKRAVSDAIRHSSLSFVRLFGKTAHEMFVDVTIGVPNPEGLDTAAVAKELPYGKVTVTAVKGGLEVPAEQGGDGARVLAADRCPVGVDLKEHALVEGVRERFEAGPPADGGKLEGVVVVAEPQPPGRPPGRRPR